MTTLKFQTEQTTGRHITETFRPTCLCENAEIPSLIYKSWTGMDCLTIYDIPYRICTTCGALFRSACVNNVLLQKYGVSRLLKQKDITFTEFSMLAKEHNLL